MNDIILFCISSVVVVFGLSILVGLAHAAVSALRDWLVGMMR